MGHYAKVLNGIVTEVIVAEPDFLQTYKDSSPGEWIQTSYNTYGNVHYGQDGNPDGGVPLRGNYASFGYIYDSSNDVFYTRQPYLSWVLNKSTWLWEAPISCPDDGNRYNWDESTVSWKLA